MKLLDKDILVSEIEKRKKRNLLNEGAFEEDIEIISLINTLEVEGVNLEDSIKESLVQKYIDYTFKRYNIDSDSREAQLIYYAYMHGMNQCLDQLNKAQKKE